MAGSEVAISPEAPRPRGYGFLKKGNAFMTALCRRKTRAAGKTLYVVTSRGVSSGLLAPRGILLEVFVEEVETRDKRSAVVKKRDDAVKKEFEQAILRLYPKVPPEDVVNIASRTLKKRRGRVGRVGKLDLETKVNRAVAAHVRHQYTEYEKLVRGSITKWAARDSIREEASRILASWRGHSSSPPKRQSAARQRESPSPRLRRRLGTTRLARRTRKARKRRAGGISSTLGGTDAAASMMEPDGEATADSCGDSN